MIIIIFIILFIILLFLKKERFDIEINPYNSNIKEDIKGSIKKISKNKNFYSIKNELDYYEMDNICKNIIDKHITIKDSFKKTETNNFINKIIAKELLKRINHYAIKYYDTIYKESNFTLLKLFPLETLINNNFNINNIILIMHINRPNTTHYFIIKFNVFIYLNNFKILVKDCNISGVKLEDDLKIKKNYIINNYCNYKDECKVLLPNINNILNNRKQQIEYDFRESQKKCIGKNSKTEFDCISYGPGEFKKGEWK